MSENKNSYFTIKLIDIKQSKFDRTQNQVDLIFSAMRATNNWYSFWNPTRNQLIYLFHCEARKRRGQLVKLCESQFDEKQDWNATAVTKFTFVQDVARLKTNKNFKVIHEPGPIGGSEYNADDIKIFDDLTCWYPWQTKVYDMIFDSINRIKPADPRHIISIVDETGNSGKSSFFKWIFYHHNKDVARLEYGTASQLRSAVVNLGKRKLYIIDLARTKGKEDNEFDLLAGIECVKNGLISQLMRGSGAHLIMEPPHVIISSNYYLSNTII